MNAVDTFRSKSSGIVARLLGDFPVGHEDAFAIVGNGPGHESAGTTKLQEISPTVKGSRGGFGWFQWTGPRRRAFEAYCARNKLDPRSDEANYAWLFLELKGSEARAITALLVAKAGLRDKVVAFELAYERAGVKHYDSRLQWAEIAATEWERSGQEPAPMPAERKKTILVDEAEAIDKRAKGDLVTAGRSTGGGVVAGSGGVVAHNAVPWADLLLLGLGFVLIGAAVWLVLKARKQALAAAALYLEASKPTPAGVR